MEYAYAAGYDGYVFHAQQKFRTRPFTPGRHIAGDHGRCGLPKLGKGLLPPAPGLYAPGIQNQGVGDAIRKITYPVRCADQGRTLARLVKERKDLATGTDIQSLQALVEKDCLGP